MARRCRSQSLGGGDQQCLSGVDRESLSGVDQKSLGGNNQDLGESAITYFSELLKQQLFV
jgi:hypothetical protein